MSAAYGYISFLMAWLKCYYPSQYMAAVLSMQDSDEAKDKYIKSCMLNNDITTNCPDINTSEIAFTATDDNTIRYGLGSIRGVGEAKLETLINNAPYASLEDMFERLPKSIFNKTVAENLAKCGALDSICGKNRNKTLNEIHRIRKDKKAGILDEAAYDRETCMQYEIGTLGTSVTYKSEWDDIPNNTEIKNKPVTIVDVKDCVARSSGKSMGRLKVVYDGANVDAIIFPMTWTSMVNKPVADKNVVVNIDGKKDKEGNLIIKQIRSNVIAMKEYQDDIDDSKNVVADPFDFTFAS